tara:strand:- start:536 stop:1429 length:894 start_codon:yes stop_codon:yes gene_type:complete
MKEIQITGSSGFVGINLLNSNYFKNKFSFKKIFLRKNIIPHSKKSYAFIHLAGLAHDTKKSLKTSEYYKVNYELTKIMYNKFLSSKAKKFIIISSVKAVRDNCNKLITEKTSPIPKTHYGKSKLLAEKYIINKKIGKNKKYFILRPCMIHGPKNKGNLNLLYKYIKKGYPWPLASFINQRSYLSIDNLNFVINELLNRNDIPSGIYNVSDDDTLSTNEIVKLINQKIGKKNLMLNIPKTIINLLFKIGDVLNLNYNSETLNKLTGNYIVSNEKIKKIVNKPFPISSKKGMKKTINSF